MKKITTRFFSVYGFIAGLVIITMSSLPTWGQNTSYNDNSLNIGGTNSVGIGSGALNVNTGGSNTAIGFQALRFNTTGSSNTANGRSALSSNTTGDNNTANGRSALFSNNTGNTNTANGRFALFFNTTGSNNTANGDRALQTNTTGFNNIAMGDSAGFASLGSGNIYIGHRSGALETGSNKLYIGNDDNKTILYGDINTGQVLLGKPDATGYSFKGTRTLNVLGGILADSVRVALSGLWADYVFNEDYQLLAPETLKAYIKNNKHLPGIPTQQQVKKEGVQLAEMNTKLLEKIEELTLYMLKQQEQINSLQAITTKQMALIGALEKKGEKMP